MAPYEEFRQQIAEVMESEWVGNEIQFQISVDSPQEAKSALASIRQKQKYLRQIKREIGQCFD